MASKEKKIIYISYLNDDSSNILELFNGLFDVDAIVKDNTLIYLLKDEKMYEDYGLNNMIDTVKEDFGININIFESNIIKEEYDEFELINIYKTINKSGYVNISQLVLSLVEKENKYLSLLKKYVLYSFEKDSDLLFVCKAMFKNNLNVSKASEDAYMHRNTVNNKLDLINKKTSLNIQKFSDAMAMYILINTK